MIRSAPSPRQFKQQMVHNVTENLSCTDNHGQSATIKKESNPNIVITWKEVLVYDWLKGRILCSKFGGKQEKSSSLLSYASASNKHVA